MKIERTKNAGRNIIFGTILKVYQMVIPFLMRTVMIYSMGVEYLGLNSLFTSILQVLNLAELGVGSAMVYSMYKPIAEDNKREICALMKLYRFYYRIIGIIILVAGMCLLPFIPKLIKSDVPQNININILYLLNLAITVLSYWLFAYKNCLLDAYQRRDVTSKVTLITNTLQYGLQIVVLFFLKNYYIYVIVMLVTQILTNVSIAYVVTKMFPQYIPKGKMSSQDIQIINHRIRDLFTSKIGSVIVNSADTLVISAFLGLKMLAIYQNYFYILTAIIGIVGILFGSCTAGIGNSIIVETKEKNFNDLKKFTFILMWISGFSATCLLCLYQPFMEIWVGKNLQLEFGAVICFTVYYFVYELNQLLNLYKDASGMWHEDRFRPLVTALTNLGLNLVMVQFWGIYGVLLSTVLSMLFVGMPWLLHNLFTVIFKHYQMRSYLKGVFMYTTVAVATAALTFCVCEQMPLRGWNLLICRTAICCIIPNVIFFITYKKLKEFSASIELLDRLTKGKFHFALKKYIK